MLAARGSGAGFGPELTNIRCFGGASYITGKKE
jgi:hypothetical protein